VFIFSLPSRVALIVVVPERKWAHLAECVPTYGSANVTLSQLRAHIDAMVNDAMLTPVKVLSKSFAVRSTFTVGSCDPHQREHVYAYMCALRLCVSEPHRRVSAVVVCVAR